MCAIVSINESYYICSSVRVCYLRNSRLVGLVVMEVQYEEYLGKDGIVRYEDVYGYAKDMESN